MTPLLFVRQFLARGVARDVHVADDRGRQIVLCPTPAPGDWPKHLYLGKSAAIEQVGEPWVTEEALQRKWLFWNQALWILMSLLVWRPLAIWWPAAPWWIAWSVSLGIVLIIHKVAAPLLNHHWRSRARRTIIVAYLSASRCPSCREFIDINAAADGCSECAKCGAAWRVPAQAQRDKPYEPPPKMPFGAAARLDRGECPWCGYSRVGLADDDPCPECGRMTIVKAVSTPPPPLPPRMGRPVCARCRGSMRGREDDRTCPSCGAMYGVEWLPEDEPAPPIAS